MCVMERNVRDNVIKWGVPKLCLIKMVVMVWNVATTLRGVAMVSALQATLTHIGYLWIYTDSQDGYTPLITHPWTCKFRSGLSKMVMSE